MEYDAYQTSSAQKRLYLINQLYGDSVLYNINSAWIIEGNLNVLQLEKALKKLVERHETLRTSFAMKDGKVFQKVFAAIDVELKYHSPGGSTADIDLNRLLEEFLHPFDLDQVPLWRAEVIQLEPEKYILLFDIHHIISDGVSMNVLISELAALYSGVELPPLEFQYVDFTMWQNNMFSSEQMKKQEEYWLNVFAGELPLLDISYDYPRPLEADIVGRTVKFELNTRRTAAINQLVVENKTTLYVVLLTVYNVLLSRYTGQEDIIVGSPISGRTHKEFEPIIGMFVNTLALRNQPLSQLTFKHFLETVSKNVFAAFNNQDYPFEMLVEKLVPQRHLNRNPLIDTMLALQNLPKSIEMNEGNGFNIKSTLRIIPYPHHEKVAKFDLTLIAHEEGQHLIFILEYRTSLFREDTIERMIGHFKNIVHSVCENSRVPLADIDILDPEEKQLLLYDFNQTDTDSPTDETIHQLFEEQVEKTPDRIAVVGQSEEGRHASTYKELNEKSNQLAYYLREKGAKPDTIVAIMMERSLEMVIGILGILKSGAAYLPIDPDYPEKRIEYILKDSNAKILLATPAAQVKVEVKVKEKNEAIGGINIIELFSSSASTCKVSSANLAYIIYTSGTTGGPKGVVVRHQGVVNFVVFHHRVFDTGVPCRMSQVASQGFDAMAFEVWPCLLKGAALYIAPGEIRIDPEKIKEWLIRNRISVSFQPTAMALELLNLEWPQTEVSLKALLTAGDRLTRYPPRSFPFRLYNLYGPTEDTVWTTWAEVPVITDKEINRCPPIGSPIANHRVYILGRDLQLQPIGVVGELCIAGVGIGRGYLNNPELTADRFIHLTLNTKHLTLYKSGDLACWLPDGNIQFLGRVDLQVKLRGCRIEPGEIEQRLLAHEMIKEAVVVLGEGHKNEPFLCAYLVLQEPGTIHSNDLSVGSWLREYLSRELPDYMIPSHFVELERLPVTSSGKVNRNVLPVPEISTERAATAAPGNEIEKKLVDIWSEVLGIPSESMGIDANFFELGGHSLKATLLISKIHKELNVKIPMAEVFSRQTIQALARYIEKTITDIYVKYSSIEELELKEYYGLSSAQKRLYILQQMTPESTAYNLPQVIPIEGPDIKKLERTLKRLIQHHESLRTSFHVVSDEPVQRIHESVEFEIVRLEADEFNRKEFVRAFDLSQAPLLRVGLVKKKDHQEILMVDMHHIITDGTSQVILEKEFMALYTDPDTQLSPLRLQYKDFSQWQNRKEQRESLNRQKLFWLKVFVDELPVLDLPTDYPRPLMQRFEGNTVNFILSEAETRTLKNMAEETRATLYMCILAVYTIFLAKLSGQEDIIVGTPTAARRHTDLEGIIGMFVNTLAMRNYPANQKQFDQFLLEVKERTLDAFENQEYQFEDLVEEVSLRRDTSRNPIFDVMFNLLNQSDYTGYIPETEEQEWREATSKFDLNLTAVDIGKRLLFNLEFSTCLFNRHTIARIICYFRNIISVLSRDDGRTLKLSDIGILSGKEKEEILQLSRGIDAAADYDTDTTIHRLFEDQVSQTPDKIAVSGMAQVHAQVRNKKIVHITYSELNRKANQFARTLRQKGLKPDSVVGIMAERSIEMIIGMLAILKAGGAYLPVDPEYPEERKRYMLEDSGVNLLLTTDELEADDIETIDLWSENIYHIYHRDGTNLEYIDDRKASDLVYVIYTSGSTGKPKGVMLEHRNLVNLIKYQYRYTTIDFSRVLQFTTISFDVSFQEIFSTLLAGGNLFLIESGTRGDVPGLCKVIEKNLITTLFLPASYLKFVFSEASYRGLMPGNIRHIAAAGEQLVITDEFRKYLRSNRVYLHNHYGPAECHVVTTLTLEPGGELPELPSIGRPIANARIYILDKAGGLQIIGVPGELYIGGIAVGRGYIGRGQLTAEKFIRWSLNTQHLTLNTRLYRTGDLARWLSDGNIQFLGRIDHQVKIRGFRVEPGEIENRLLNHDAIQEAVVTVQEDENGDRYLCAYFVAKTGGKFFKTGSVSEIREFLSQTLPDYMVPSYFVSMEAIPLTPSGKVDRKALPAPDYAVDQAPGAYAAPRDYVENRLVEIWSEILNIPCESLGIVANFFDLGGHSLKATVMVSKIHKVLDVKVPLAEVFRSPTIRGLSAYIRKEASTDVFTSIEPGEEKEYYPLSGAQQRFYLLQQMAADTTAYNMPHLLYPLKIDKEKLEETLKKLIQRHESLRTSFQMVEGELVQRIYPAEEIEFSIEYYDTNNRDIIKNFVRPFDLSKAPLFRVGLIQTVQPGGHQNPRNTFMVDIHHIVSDGTSQKVLFRDYESLYSGKALPPLRLQYRDFSQWQHDLIRSGEMKLHEDYWLDHLEGQLPEINLPTDYPAPAIRSYEGHVLQVSLEKELVSQLYGLMHRTGTTLYMVLLAVFNILLFKYTGQQDIIIGSPMASRVHADLEDIIGLVMEFIMIRNFPNGEKTFMEFLEEVKPRILRAIEHQVYPYSELEKKIGYKTDSFRKPITNVSLMVQNMFEAGGGVFEEHEGEHEQQAFTPNTSKLDLTIAAWEGDKTVFLDIEYSTLLFKQETIERLAGHFVKIIDDALTHPDKQLSEIELLSQKEKEMILYRFNDTALEEHYPLDKMVYRLFAEQVEKAPDRIAIVNNGHQLNYRELNRRANRLACRLREKGAGPNSIVAIMVEPSMEMITGILGILKAGGAYLPIDPEYPRERIDYILADSNARILVSELSKVSGEIEVVKPGELSKELHTHLTHLTNLTHLCYIIYTSGSTGRPKGVMVTHRNLMAYLNAFENEFDLRASDVVIQQASFTFDAFVEELYPILLKGGRLAIPGKDEILDIDLLSQFIQMHHISMITCSPLMLNELNKLEHIDRLRNVRIFISGGDRLKKDYIDRLLQIDASVVYNTYGPTEATVCAAYYRCGEDSPNGVPIGKPIANYRVYVLDRHENLLPIGLTGELCISGAGVSRGYLNRPELTAERFVDYRSNMSYRTYIFYKTGDLARWLPDGNIEFMGRMDEQANIRGYRIEPGEIEYRLLQHPQVRESMVTVIEDSDGDQSLCAYFVANAGGKFSETGSVSEIREFLSQTLPDYMVPAYFVPMEAIPLTPSGKVDRKALPAPDYAVNQAPGAYAAPRDYVENRLVEIWSEILNIPFESLGIAANFFDLGGHSLKATVMVSKIHKVLDVKIPLAEVFKSPTIRGLSRYIRQASMAEDVFVSIEPAEQREYYPLSRAQERFYFLQHMAPESTAYNLIHVFHPQKEIDRIELEQAFIKLITRHESLRTSFQVIDEHGQLVQKIHPVAEIEFKLEYHKMNDESSIIEVQKIIKDFVRPFDLSRAPLLRVGLIGKSDSRVIMMVDMHHIISDGTSYQVLNRDFMSLYEREKLPLLRLQYKDFSQWQHDLIRSGKIKIHEDYWLDQLAGLLPEIRLPTDYPKPEARDFAGYSFRRVLTDELVRDLRALTQNTGTTLYMVFLAAYNVLLFKYTGQTDIIIGSPIARRDHADLENIIGLVMESIMMRNFPKGEKTFREFLQEVKEKTLDAYEHQVYPYEELIKKLNYTKDSPRTELTNVSLIVQNMVDPKDFSPTAAANAPAYIPTTAKLDLTISVWESRENISLDFEYSTRLFKQETIERLAVHFVNILEEAIKNLDAFLSYIDIFSDQEKTRVIGSPHSYPCYPLSHAQKRIYYTEKIYPDTSCNSLAFTVMYSKILDKQLLEQAINWVIRKNDSLRLRIVEFDFHHEPSQYIIPFKPFKLDVLDFSEAPGGFEEGLRQWIEEDVRKPFQFYNSDLYYFAYIKENENESGFYMKLHHIVMDGWALFLLQHEITGIYETLEAGSVVDETPNPSYIDYLFDEITYLKSSRAAADRKSWHNTLLPLPEEIQLFENKINTDVTSIEGAAVVLPFPDDLRTKILHYCQTDKTSIFKLLLSALSIFISRVTGRDDTVIGSAGHNRGNDIYRKSAGMFVSTVPLRIRIEERMDFREFLEKVGEDTNTILKNHQTYPFDRLTAELREETGIDPAYLLNINLVGHPDVPEDKFRIEHHFPGYEPTPLSIHINGNNRNIHGILELEWNYQPHRCSFEEITRMHQCLVNILEDALSPTGKKLSEIELLSEKEKEQILYEFNDTAQDYPSDKMVHQLFQEQAARTPGHTAVISVEHRAESIEQLQITYDELNAKSDRLAHYLREKGFQPDTIVALMVGPSIEMAIGILGILKAGGAYLPIDPDYPEERRQYMLADSGARILVSELSEVSKVSEEIEVVKLSELSEKYPTHLTHPTHLCYVIYTSGSTGKPKAVGVEHRNLLGYIDAFADEFDLRADDVVVQQASFSFDAFVEEFYPILLKGGKLAIPGKDETLDSDLLTQFIQMHHISMITCSPLMLNELNKLEHIDRLRNVRIFISGGDRLKKDYIDRLLHIDVSAVYNTYGPTEATVCAAYYRCGEDSSNGVPIGKPITNYRVYVLDKHGNLLPIGVTGELCISGAGVSRGYLNRPELTAERFSKKIYRTGDLARWLPDGNIEFMGRMDEQVNIRGYRIEPGEIEYRLLQHPQVRESLVIVVEDSGGDQSLCAYIVGAETKTSELKNYLSQTLPEFMIPTYILAIEKIPLTSNGKVDKKSLPDPGEGQARLARMGPRNKTEEKLVRIFSDILYLERESISIDDNFFDIGGHSLKATLLASTIQKELDVKVSLAEIFNRPTIMELSRYIDKAGKQHLSPINQAEIKLFYPLSSAQKRLYVIQQLDPKSTAYNIPTVVGLEGELNIGPMDLTFRTLVQRHESFRTSFHMIAREPVQRIHQEVPFVMEYYDVTLEWGADVETIIANFIRPFDLSRPPLLRGGIVKVDEKRHVLMVDMHHIISDGLSMNIFIREFIKFYNGQELPSLDIQYKDFAQWQNQEREKGVFKRQEDFWLNLFEGEIPKLKLPFDYPVPPVPSFEGSRFGFEVEKDLIIKIKENVSRTGTTLHQFLLAVYNILLYRYTRQEDIIVGYPVTGRSHADLQPVIGMFVNMLPMRNQPQGNKTFRQFLEEVRENALNAHENQDYPFEELVVQLGLQGEAGGSPLFNVAFALHTREGTKTDSDDGILKVIPVEFEHKVSIFDITLRAYEAPDAISMVLEYKTALFKPSTMEKYAKRYIEILEQVVENIDLQLKDISVSHELLALKTDVFAEEEGDFRF